MNADDVDAEELEEEEEWEDGDDGAVVPFLAKRNAPNKLLMRSLKTKKQLGA
jgi:hypothetical protein